jgi:hypothetical protein
MVRWYKDKAVSWVNEYSPILDVTNIARATGLKWKKAYLAIYGDDLSKIRIAWCGYKTPVYYPDGRPADPKLFGEEAYKNILINWLNGEEWERMYCSKDGKTCWVVFPCRLAQSIDELKGKVDMKTVGAAVGGAVGGFVAGLLLGRRRP